MELEFEKILSISGLGGLHTLKSSNKNGFYVEEIGNGKVRFIADISNRVASLDNISIYTMDDSIPLANIFLRMDEKAGELAVPKASESANNLKSYFLDILPDYDEERVYVSDIKKVIKWYNLLVANKADFAAIVKDLEEKEAKAAAAAK